MAELPFTRLPVPAGPLGVAAVARAAAAVLDGGPAFAPVPPDQRHDLPTGDVPAGLGVVVTTSGTTGAPLHVLIGREALLASARVGAAALGSPGHWLTTIPVTSIGGVLTAVRALLAGAEPIAWTGVGGAEPFTAESFAAAGSEVLRRATSDGVPAYTSLVPTQLARIVRLPAATEALAGFSGVLVGGAALAPALRSPATAAGARLVETYGATETCGGVVYDGVPLPGVDVRLDEQPDLPEATVSIGGATVASGYLGKPGLSEATFAGGWFRSSDLGRCEAGRLRLLGRRDSVVKIGGVKVALDALTAALRADSRVLDAHVTAAPDREWGHRLEVHVVPADPDVVGTAGAQRLEGELADALSAGFGGAARPRSVTVVADLPVTSAGKPILNPVR